MVIKELATTNHFKQRIEERVNSMEISLPFNLSQLNIPEAQAIEKLKQFFINAIRERINKTISSEEEDYGAIVIADLYVSYKGKSYKPTIIAKDKQQSTGSLYYIVYDKGAASTIVLTSESDEFVIRKLVVQHYLRKYRIDIGNSNVKFSFSNSAKIVAKLEELIQSPQEIVIPSAEILEYTPRTDYRKNSNFVHKKYGEGISINTSNGIAGKGDGNGKLEWVDVDFKKPFLKDGKLTTIRRVPNVYTLPGLQKLQHKEAVNIFESISFNY